MSERISIKQLEELVAKLNTRTGQALQPYTRVDGKLIANIGNFHLDSAYGGYRLAKLLNQGGGVEAISTIGYAPKRELYNWIVAYMAGLSN